MSQNRKLWYTVQPKEGNLEVSYEQLSPKSCGNYESKDSLYKPGKFSEIENLYWWMLPLENQSDMRIHTYNIIFPYIAR